MRDKYAFDDIRRFEGLAPAMLDMQTGRIDGYISDIPSLEYFIKDKPYFKVIERIETGERYSMMLAKNNPLVDEVDAIITTLKQEGFVAELHKQWFGTVAADASSTVTVTERPATR
jgi:polar amino acid transport system substrate-binding protein